MFGLHVYGDEGEAMKALWSLQCGKEEEEEGWVSNPNMESLVRFVVANPPRQS